MKIGIDARLLSTKIGGTSRYLINLIKYIPQFDFSNRYYIFQYENMSRENEFYTYLPIRKMNIPRQIYEHYWLNFSLPKIIKQYKIDIFFTPYIFLPLTNMNCKKVIAVHDSLTKICKQYYTFHYRKYMDILVPPSIRKSDAIITVSSSAKDDIIRFYDVPDSKIKYLHLWTDENYKPINISIKDRHYLINKYGLPDKFILYVGVLEERKNILGIIKVSDILFSKGISIKFVLIGRRGFGFKSIEKELEKRKDRIIYIEKVEEFDLVLIYNFASLFFFPSHYEGFGLPPLEAIKCGLPVVASNNSSLPEVIGNGGVMGKANDHEFFATKIVELLNDDKYYEWMKIKAIEQSKKFSAANHLEKLIAIFNSMKN